MPLAFMDDGSEHLGQKIHSPRVPISVLEMIAAFEEESGVKVPYEFEPRRSGDLSEFWADVSKAELKIGWRASRTLMEMMRDTWCWQRKNPFGYE